jgi:hypothetical protein
MGKVKGIQRGRRSYAEMQAEIEELKAWGEEQEKTIERQAEERDAAEGLARAFGIRMMSHSEYGVRALFQDIQGDMPESYHRPTVAGIFRAIQTHIIHDLLDLDEDGEIRSESASDGR